MKRFISILVLTLMILTSVSSTLSVQAADGGMRFNAGDVYMQKEAYKSAPVTFEAWIKLSASQSGRGGVIIGNYDKNPNLNFEIYDGGAPRFYINGDNYVFNNVNVFTGEWVHLAIVYDASAAKIHCYLNGNLAQTLSSRYSGSLPSSHPQVLGGDARGGNAQYFKGEIREVAVFSKVRTAAEIKADSQKVEKCDSLLAHYDLSAQSESGIIRDLSGNKNDCTLPNYLPELPDGDGMIFSANDIYRANAACSQSPNTFEATVYFSKAINSSVRGGVVLGNFDNNKCSLSFEIHTSGAPRLYYTDDAGNLVIDVKFNNVNLYDGKWNHIAIVRDPQSQTVKCYLNGTLAQTVSCNYTDDLKIASPMGFGGDYRSGNSCYFKGIIQMAAMYEDARSASQIKEDCEAALSGDINALETSDCISLYDTVECGEDGVIFDLSQNRYDIEKRLVWFDEKQPIDDYAYSFAVIGDTQVVADRYADQFHKIYDYIIDNIDEKNIQFVLGMGDITERNTAEEWQLATDNIFRLDGKVGYSLVRGNHDGKNEYNANINSATYKNSLGGSYDGILNTWQTLTVGEIKYLIFGLDYGASDAVLRWASGVIEEHPDHNVIITTHAYLFRDGTTLDQNDVCPPATTGGYNNGDHMWNKLIKKHKNIVLVLSGHDPCDNVIMTQTKGENGNTVTQMLIDGQGVDAAQGASGLVAMLYFSEDGKKVSVEYYSTIKEQYFMSDSQFSFELDLVDEEDIGGGDVGGGDDEDDESKNEGGENTEKPTEKPTEKATDTKEPDPTEAPSDSTNSGAKSGCGASAASVTVLLVTLLGSAALLKKNKKY